MPPPFSNSRKLLVSSTALEVAPLASGYSVTLDRSIPAGKIFRLAEDLDLLICGVGQMQAAFHMGRALENGYGLVLNFGIAGSFDAAIGKRSAVWITEEILADLGAESPEGYLDLFEM